MQDVADRITEQVAALLGRNKNLPATETLTVLEATTIRINQLPQHEVLALAGELTRRGATVTVHLAGPVPGKSATGTTAATPATETKVPLGAIIRDLTIQALVGMLQQQPKMLELEAQRPAMPAEVTT